MVIGGGAENCLGAEEDTAAPWAAGEALLDGEVEADGFGSGLSALLICAEDGGAAAGLVGAGAWAAGAAAFWPQPATSSTRAKSANLKLKFDPIKVPWAVYSIVSEGPATGIVT
jgi:hypothetical protein